jgi:peptidoglycan/xylan/chitin deacetylase (PgdA/CDA1 family)
MSLRSQFTQTVYQMLLLSGAARRRRKSHAAVFCYHNVVSDEVCTAVNDLRLHIGITAFAEQIDWINRSFAVIPITELVDRLRRGRSVAGTAAISFDDAYNGVITNAVPIIRKALLPFTVFPVVEASTLNRPFWWDLFDELTDEQRTRYLVELKGDHEAIVAEAMPRKELPKDATPADWNTLRRVLGEDCTIGVHTMTHRNLAALSEGEIGWEISQARKRTADELGVEPTVVAYPYGMSNERVHEQTKRNGFDAGFVLGYELVGADVSHYSIPRINVPTGIPLANFAGWASGLRLRS